MESSSEKKHAIHIDPQLIAMGGDLVVGSLLSQIAYWSKNDKKGKTKLRVKRGGMLWIAKTREQWMAESGISLKQYKRAIVVLKDKGIVETKLMKFNGVPTTHLRLKGEVRPDGTIRLDPNGPPHCTPTDHLYTETTTENTNSVLAKTQAPELETETAETSTTLESVQSVHENATQEESVKAADILKQQKEQKGQGTSGSLDAFWKSRMALISNDFQKPLTMKEKGQLGQLRKALGDQTRTVIDYAIAHWVKFSVRAAQEAGSIPPTQPNVGFLLKHYHVAVKLLQSIAPVPVEVIDQPVHEGSPPKEQTVEALDKPHALSQEELDAMLAGLNE